MLHKSLAIERPDLVAQWHPSKNLPLTPNDVTAGMETRVWWKCSRGRDHVWEATVLGRAHKGNGCPFCANRRAGLKNSLAILAPKLAREWHPTKNGKLQPTDVVHVSSKMVWWRCKYGHEWYATVISRTRNGGTGCPGCGGVTIRGGRAWRFSSRITMSPRSLPVCHSWSPSGTNPRSLAS